MEDIEYRAWIESTKFMCYKAHNCYDTLGCDGECGLIADSFGCLITSKECILMQYTGLKDKNDKKIFELMEINYKYRVEYIAPEYILTNISNGDIISFKEVLNNENELTITKEYTEI